MNKMKLKAGYEIPIALEALMQKSVKNQYRL